MFDSLCSSLFTSAVSNNIVASWDEKRGSEIGVSRTHNRSRVLIERDLPYTLKYCTFPTTIEPDLRGHTFVTSIVLYERLEKGNFENSRLTISAST